MTNTAQACLTRVVIKLSGMVVSAQCWLINLASEVMSQGVAVIGLSFPNARCILITRGLYSMLSQEEIETLQDIRQGLSIELQIICIWISRVTKLSPQDALKSLRESVIDVQDHLL